MQTALHTMERQMECIREMYRITESLFEQLELWSEQELEVVLDQEWKGIRERDNLYNEAAQLEELLKQNPYYATGSEAIRQKVKQRNDYIEQIQEMDCRISEAYQALKAKTMLQLSGIKQRSKATRSYGHMIWSNPAFIDERQ